jgi:hypothetical protein
MVPLSNELESTSISVIWKHIIWLHMKAKYDFFILRLSVHNNRKILASCRESSINELNDIVQRCGLLDDLTAQTTSTDPFTTGAIGVAGYYHWWQIE